MIPALILTSVFLDKSLLNACNRFHRPFSCVLNADGKHFAAAKLTEVDELAYMQLGMGRNHETRFNQYSVKIKTVVCLCNVSWQ